MTIYCRDCKCIPSNYSYYCNQSYCMPCLFNRFKKKVKNIQSDFAFFNKEDWMEALGYKKDAVSVNDEVKE